MEHNDSYHDRAYKALLEAIERRNNDNVCIGELERELSKLKKKREQDINEERVLAANYFTEEIISDIHEKSIVELKKDDFNTDDYIKIFSDVSTIKTENVDFLVQRQEQINYFEKKFRMFESEEEEKKVKRFFYL